jgi:hypothetical protein
MSMERNIYNRKARGSLMNFQFPNYRFFKKGRVPFDYFKSEREFYTLQIYFYKVRQCTNLEQNITNAGQYSSNLTFFLIYILRKGTQWICPKSTASDINHTTLKPFPVTYFIQNK